MPKQDRTEIIVVLDRSGSMAGIKEDTKGASWTPATVTLEGAQP